MAKYRIRPGAKRITGLPLPGSVCWRELDNTRKLGCFIRVTYISDDVICGKVVECESEGHPFKKGSVIPSETISYAFFPAEEIPE